MRTRTDRIREIASLVNDSKNNQKVPWKGDKELFPVIRIDSDFLLYRIINSRTRRQQQRYITQHELNKDYFNDPEAEEIQKAQDEILFEMAKSQSGFLEDLKNRGQNDDLIITYDGYIINGNRRSSALRDMGVTYFDCIVLPESASKKDLYKLEQELQISRDFTQEYDWVNELNNIREGLEDISLDMDEDELADNLKITTRELSKRIRIIELVDEFLDWISEPGDYSYHKLDKAEQSFIELEKGLRKFNDDFDAQEAIKYQIFTTIEKPPKRGRVYTYQRDLIKNYEHVKSKLSKNDSTIQVNEEPINEDNLFDQLIDPEESLPVVDFSDHKDLDENSSQLYEAIDDAKAELKDIKDAEAVYNSSRDALRSLSGLIVDDQTEKKEETVKILNELISQSNKLIRELE